jgi:Raf kinase inhibitor-like YbhB/YbcL family protein
MRLISFTCVMVQVIALTLILMLRTISTAADRNPALTLTSSAFESGGHIPELYTCSGNNEPPALKWTGVPDSTQSLVLILDDPDAPMGTFVHWVVYNLSPNIKGLPEAASASTSVADAEQGINGLGSIGYTGPCPPPGKPHHYHFRLYALDQRLELRAGSTAQQVKTAMKAHVISNSELVGIFER